MMTNIIIGILIFVVIGLGLLLLKQQKQLGRVEELERTNQDQKEQNTKLTNELNETKKLLDDVNLDNAKLSEREKALQDMKKQQEADIKNLIEEQNKRFNALQESAANEFQKITAESRNIFKKTVEDSIKESKTELETKSNELYSPLKKQLDDFNAQVFNLRKESAEKHINLQHAIDKTLEMNDKLGKEAHDLTEALKMPKIQGNWGETILENVFNTAGLREGIDYEKQFYLQGEDRSRQFVDFVLNLPQGKKVAIDSKMSINSFKNWANAETEEEKNAFLKEHIKAIRDRIDELSGKEYQQKMKDSGLDFIFMFIPIEYAYFVAMQADISLNQYAKDKHISIVTVSNLFAIIQVVDRIWSVEKINENTDAILKLGNEMIERVNRFKDRMDDIQDKIKKLDKSYNEAEKSLTGQKGIIKTAQKLEDLSKNSSKLDSLLEESKTNSEADNILLDNNSDSSK
jgi:Uncharacterized protein conserved in bacteria